MRLKSEDSKFVWANKGVRSMGTLFIGPAKTLEGCEDFDYTDNYMAKTLMIRLHEICIVAVFNDSTGTMSYMNQRYISKITEGLTFIQIRELFVRFAHCNLSIKTRPKFYSGFTSDNHYIITSKRPPNLEFHEADSESFGQMMGHYCGPLLKSIGVSEEDLDQVKQGIISYVLNENGDFNTNSVTYLQNEEKK